MRLLNPKLMHSFLRSPRSLCEIFFLLWAASASLAASPPTNVRNFVACPIVRDTQTVPCWLAEYEGELYYLGIQTDISADWYPPYLGHRVLVEGTVTDDYRICGGLVLKPVVTSSLPELDPSCNTMLPAEERYTVPFAPRGPGPSKGSLAFGNVRPPAQAAVQAQVQTVQREFIVPYEFDWPWVTGKTSRVVQQAVRFAQSIKATHIEVRGYRGATLLSNGTPFVEQEGIAERRAKQVVELLEAVGIESRAIKVSWNERAAAADGDKDFESRKVEIIVTP